MAHRAKHANDRNHRRQIFYRDHGIIMLPTIPEEISIKKRIAKMRKAQHATPSEKVMNATAAQA